MHQIEPVEKQAEVLAELTPKPEMVFAVAQPLGRLARWMRLMGFDTLYEPGVTPARFEKRCHEGIYLTRTRAAGEQTGKRIQIETDRVKEQLQEVVSALGLQMSDLNPFSRCAGCNAVVHKMDKQRLKSQVPDYVWETHRHFSRCSQCRRIYWPGSHTRRSLAFIQALFSPRGRQGQDARR